VGQSWITAAGDFGSRCVPGRKGEQRRTEELTRGATLPARGKEREGSARGAGLVAGPAHAGREKKRGLERERERGVGQRGPGGRNGREEESWAGPRGFGLPFLFSFLSFFSFSPSTLKPFKQNYLNSTKFEFKPYTLNTNKTMRQHECTSKLIL
jgi:hypothetical protein